MKRYSLFTTEQKQALEEFTSAGWQDHQEYFGFIFVQWQEYELHHPFLLALIDFNHVYNTDVATLMVTNSCLLS